MLSITEAAARLSAKESELADAGEKHGLPWAKANGGIEYVWVDDVLHVLWKPSTRTERAEPPKPPTTDWRSPASSAR